MPITTHKPSNVAWQIFRESPVGGGAWRLVPVLVATRPIAVGEELLRDYVDVSYRSNLPVPVDQLDELGAGDEPWVHQALDQMALECTEVLDDLLPPRQFDLFSAPASVIPFQDPSPVYVSRLSGLCG